MDGIKISKNKSVQINFYCELCKTNIKNKGAWASHKRSKIHMINKVRQKLGMASGKIDTNGI
jgi:hypothetical protein